MHFKRKQSSLAIGLAFAALWPALWPALGQAQVTTLPSIRVAPQESTPLQPNTAQERKRLDQVPGGTNLIVPKEQERQATLRDVLDYQPGIVVQEFFGGLDQPRLNIRGSGIQSNPVNRGVLLMQDGLPLNEADGSFVISLLELRNTGLVSVRRGANAINPGATTLGGELDFQSLTGTNREGIKIEGGSFGRFGINAAKGFQGERFDGRISFSHDKSDGYRHHSQSRRTNMQANFGARFDNGVENRTYLSYTDLKFDIPNVVSKAAMEDNPRGVLGDGNTMPDQMQNVYDRDPNRKTKQFRLANRTYWGTEALNHTVGVYWQTIDDTFTNPTTSSPTDGHTYGVQWQMAGTQGSLDYRFGLNWARTDMDRELHATRHGENFLKFGDYDLQAENRNAMLGLAWHFNPQWQVVADLKYSQAIRDAKERLSGNRLDQDWSYFSPKVGVIWAPNENQRWFANISRSNEAPTYWEIIGNNVPPAFGMGNNVPVSTRLNRLDMQKANTFEIGGNGTWGAGRDAVSWSLTLYRSEVRNELMEIADATGAVSEVINYRGKTRHQGIELGLGGSIHGLGDGALDYRLAYTYSDFRFRDGQYAGNRIAGVPEHLIGAELLYRLGGLRFGPNVRWVSEAYTDHANTDADYAKRDAYALWGFKVDYQHDKHWSAFIQADNIFDKTYASSHLIRAKYPATPGAPGFLPGTGRSFSAGLSYRF
ncbi:TonB-dependent receptor family protein [Paracandidimonas soli]|uniref:Iron complex outermembrane receptor protein n=1 Tax=Paracandidimonas soli TaxID=1917182 RepID=A0A4R3VC22_9BURK|nr:TonB-dependent receptor [Paracandidimonas soli]TCV02857.1 iron complex outermembrane receptor protein [Paracandidimonas soli]